MPDVPDVADAVAALLREAERAHRIRVVWAVECGSRAWGFPSPDSDFDVRFIYAHAPARYLRVHDPPPHPERDVIERTVEPAFDLVGWDVRKALRLFCKSNAVLLEWLVSPHVYARATDFRERLLALARRHHSRKALAFHYLHMAEGNWSAYVKGRTDVRRKKYLYILRPLVAIRWLRTQAGDRLPPLSFAETLRACPLPAAASAELAALLEGKRRSSESATGARLPALDAYIGEAFGEARTYCDAADARRVPTEAVDGVLRQTLIEAWPDRSPYDEA